MYKRWKENKGITLVSLIVLVIVLLIVSTVMVLNVNDRYNSQKLDKLASDLHLLTEKTSIYYVENKEYPTIGNGENITIGEQSIYVYEIDLTKIQGLTLNYGNREQGSDDYYVINKSTGIVYYKKGIDGIYSIKQESSIVGIDVIKITKQPEWKSVKEGESVSFKVEVDKNSGVSYQWYESNVFNKEGVAIEGETANSFTIAEVSPENEKYYYCEIIYNEFTIKTDVVKLQLKNIPIASLEDWEYYLYGTNIVLSKYIGTATDVLVPATYYVPQQDKYYSNNQAGTYNVTLSAWSENSSNQLQYLFQGNTNITSVQFKEGVKWGYKDIRGEWSENAVLNWMFTDCTALKSVSIPSSLADNFIWGTFAGCTSLERIKFATVPQVELTGDNPSNVLGLKSAFDASPAYSKPVPSGPIKVLVPNTSDLAGTTIEAGEATYGTFSCAYPRLLFVGY